MRRCLPSSRKATNMELQSKKIAVTGSPQHETHSETTFCCSLFIPALIACLQLSYLRPRIGVVGFSAVYVRSRNNNLCHVVHLLRAHFAGISSEFRNGTAHYRNGNGSASPNQVCHIVPPKFQVVSLSITSVFA